MREDLGPAQPAGRAAAFTSHAGRLKHMAYVEDDWFTVVLG
jgi:hypothetical protein